MGRTLKQFCNICDSESQFIKRTRINSDLGFLTFRCKNPQCEHEYILQIEYSHPTKPSKLQNKENK